MTWAVQAPWSDTGRDDGLSAADAGPGPAAVRRRRRAEAVRARERASAVDALVDHERVVAALDHRTRTHARLVRPAGPTSSARRRSAHERPASVDVAEKALKCVPLKAW